MSVSRLLLIATWVAALPWAAGAAERWTVAREPVPVWRAVDGEVRADERTEARARIGGLLREVAVDEGDRVEAGQQVAFVEDPELAARLAAAEAEVARLAARERVAARDLTRSRALFEANDISRARLDEVGRRAAEAANALDAAKAEVQRLRERRGRGAVLAAGAGRVIEVVGKRDSAVRPGAVVAVIAAEPFVLRVAVPERHWRRLRDGDPAAVIVAEATAPLERLRLYPDVVDGRVRADFRLPEAVAHLPIGGRVAVRLEVARVPLIVIPERFVVRRHGLAFVERVDAGRTLVQLGGRRQGGFAVLGGLRPGDVLALP